jgi:protein involved in polysaccharide export with SLBB domain
VAKIGKIGSAKIGGKMLPDAVRAIEGAFRVAGRASLPVHVHVLSVEGTALISIAGDVRAPLHLPTWDGMSFAQAITHVGGRRPGSAGRAVYLTRDGVRKFHSSVEVLDASAKPRAGDVLTLSPDL